MSAQTADPVTFEILRHRLHQITKEMAATLERAGGTVNTTQMKDYMTALYRPNGEVLSAGDSMPWHVPCGATAVRAIMDRFGDDIHEGDMFMVNDPYVAAIHQSDVYIISPIHYDDALVGWSATFVHVMDIGAMSPGGNSPNTTEVYHEGIRVGGLRLVERGVLRQDVFESLINMTRQPLMVGLDLKCEIAANNVARARLLDVIDQYGIDVVHEVSAAMIAFSEATLRRRLRDLPDGSWSAEAVITASDSWRAVVTLTKQGEHLVFDFTGTDPQASVGVNLPIHAVVGSCYEGFQAILGYDLPKNHAAMRLFEVIVPEGTLLNPVIPAPVSLNTTAGGAAARYLASASLTQMIAGSDEWAKEAMAQNLGMRFARHAGQSPDSGSYYVSTLVGLNGGGARTRKDGIDAAGIDLARPSSVHNIEWVEDHFPLLYLYRRQATDGAGAGCYRGGAGEESAFIVYGAEKGITVVALGMAGARNSGQGIYGGHPGSPSIVAHVHETDVLARIDQGSLPLSRDDIGGVFDELPYCERHVAQGDVVYVRNGSGGGMGDPISRDPAAVAQDVIDGLVTPAHAEAKYAVVVDGAGAVDGDAMPRLRLQRREGRIGKAPVLHSDDNPHALDAPRKPMPAVETERVPTEVLGPAFAALDADHTVRTAYCESCGELINLEVIRRAS